METPPPYSLQRLALDALGRLVFNLMVNRTFPQFVYSSEIKLLRKMIEDLVPPNLADLVTDKLLSIVLGILDKTVVSSYLKGDGYCSYTQRCEAECSAALSIAIATIHPSTKCFTYYRDYQGLLSFSYVRKLMRSYLGNILKLKNLKVFKLREIEFDNSDLLNGLVNPHSLVEFSYNFCSDDILEILSNNCQRLKSLDVRESYNVTDCSVDFILKFRELKFLKINNTKISCQGVTNIMKGIPQGMAGIPIEEMKLELNVFKSTFTSLHVNLVTEVYSGLTSVELYLVEECSLLPLCRLRQLRSLGLCRFGFPNAPDIHFSNAEPLLRLIGGQLWKLKLVNLNGTDLRVVAETCPVLRTLMLHFPDSRQLGFPDRSTVGHYAEFHSLPYFPSIQCLDLKIRNCNLIEYLLSRMENLKQIKIWLLYDCTESLLAALVSCFHFRKLEELEVRVYTIYLFGNHVIVTTVNGLSRERNINDLHNIIYEMFRGIDIFRSPSA